MDGERGRRNGRREASGGGDLAKMVAIAGVTQQRAFGDRRVLFVAAALPIMLIFVIGFVSGRSERVPLGVVSSSHGPFEARLVALLDSSDAVQVHMEPSVQTERDDVLRGILLESLVIPKGFDEAVERHRAAALAVTARSGNTGALGAQVAISSAYDVLVSEWAVAGHTAASSGESPMAVFARVTATTDGISRSASAKYESGLPGPYSYTTPANLVLFVFLTLLVTSSALVEERHNGLLRRMLASPTRPRVIVVAQLLSTAVLGLIQAAGLLVVGRLVFGVSWGDPVGVLLLILVLAIAAAGLSVLLGTVARSGEQAVAVGIVVAVAFGMLGGCMWNLDTVGPLMRTIGHVTPQAWAMDAFVKLVLDHSGVVGVLPEIGVLALFATGLVGIAIARLRSVTTARAATN